MQRENEVQHVFLVGAKSLGAYGGYETFVYKLTEYHQNKKNIKYHVACKANGDGCMDETKVDGVTRINDHEFEFHNAHCFKIDIPQIGPAQAIYYDVAALKACCKYIKEHRIKHPIVYIMACRIGPFAGHFYKEIHKLGGTVYLNPDGHEWMRAKWSAPIRRYWKISEQMMVKYCDLAICDSVNIEKYIHGHSRTTTAETRRPGLPGGMRSIGKKCRPKTSAACSGGTSATGKATLRAVSQTPSWRKKSPYI